MPDTILKRLEIGFRRVLVAVLARLARRSRRTGMMELRPDARILLLRHDRFGDAIVSTVVLKLLRERFPSARIDMLLGRRNRAIAPLLPAVDDCLVLEPGIGGLMSIRRRLVARHYDVVVNLHVKDSSSGALLSILSGAEARVGFDGALAGIYDYVVLRPSRLVHIVRHTALLLAPFGIASLGDAPGRESEMLELHVGGTGSPRVPRPLTGRAPRIVVSISARDEAHMWSERNVIELVDRMRDDDISWAVVGTPEHRGRVERIAASSARIEALAATDSFEKFVATLAGYDIIVTPQTSTVHIGSALRRPTILLNTTSASDSQWTPWGIPSRVLARGESVSSISVDEVAGAVRSLLDELRATEQSADAR